MPSESDTTRDPAVLRARGVIRVGPRPQHPKRIHTLLVPSYLTSREIGTRYEKAPDAGSRHGAVVSTLNGCGNEINKLESLGEKPVRNLLELPLKLFHDSLSSRHSHQWLSARRRVTPEVRVACSISPFLPEEIKFLSPFKIQNCRERNLLDFGAKSPLNSTTP